MAGFVLFREPDWIRTNDLLLRRQLLYPAELPVRILQISLYLSFNLGVQIYGKFP